MANPGIQYFQQKRYLAGPVYSLDMECVAIGPTHANEDRYPALVALVDSAGSVVCQLYVKMPENKKIFSYLTPLSGIRASDYVSNESWSLSEVSKVIKSKIPRNAVLVGQKVCHDIEWLGLTKGADFADYVDISEVFCSYNPKFGKMAYLSLIHEANVILGILADATKEHNPGKDAKMSVELWLGLLQNPNMITQWQRDLNNTRPRPSVGKLYNGNIDGVCISKFSRHLCRCNAP